MKKIVSFSLAAMTALSASTAYAGGLAEPVQVPEPIVVAGATSSSNGGLLVLLLLGVAAAAALTGGSTSGTH